MTAKTSIQKFLEIFQSGPKLAGFLVALIVSWMLVGILLNFGGDEEQKNKEISQLNKVQVERQVAQAVHAELKLLGKSRYSREVIIKAISKGLVINIDAIKGSKLDDRQQIVSIDSSSDKAEFKRYEALVKQRELEFEGAKKLADKNLLSPSRFAEAEAALESANAEKIRAEIKYRAASVRAPFSGILEEVFVEVGDYVVEGDPIAEVLDFSPFVIAGQLAEKEAGKVKVGQKAEVQFLDGEIFQGEISYISSESNEDSRSFDMEVTVPNVDEAIIRAGISSKITIPIEYQNAHLVSTSSLEIDSTGQFGIKTVNKDNLVQFHQVKIIKSDTDGVWITGLPNESLVITRGQGYVDLNEEVELVFKNKPSITHADSSGSEPSGSADSPATPNVIKTNDTGIGKSQSSVH